MRHLVLLFVLLAGCADDRAAMIKYCEEHNIPYHVGENRADKAGRFIMLNSKGFDMTDAELGEYLSLDAELHPAAATTH